MNAILGKKLKALADKEGGDFKKVEVVLKRWRSKETIHQKAGEWVTKVYLRDVKKWTQKLGKTNSSYIN